MFSGAAGVTETQYRAVGSGQTAGASSADLISLALGGNERAAVFTARAFSAQGEVREARGVGLFVPGSGWTLAAAGSNCSLTLSSLASVTFAVDGVSGTSDWIGHLSIEFTQNYAP